jgi:hypothetical protein
LLTDHRSLRRGLGVQSFPNRNPYTNNKLHEM